MVLAALVSPSRKVSIPKYVHIVIGRLCIFVQRVASKVRSAVQFDRDTNERGASTFSAFDAVLIRTKRKPKEKGEYDRGKIFSRKFYSRIVRRRHGTTTAARTGVSVSDYYTAGI